MRIISGLALLMFGLLAPAQTPPATSKVPAAPPPPGVWAKLDQDLSISFTRMGDNISLVLQEEVTVKDVKLPKGTKLTGTVVKIMNQDKANPSSGLVLNFDTAVLKNGKSIPVQVTMASIAPSSSDEVEQIELGSGAGAPSNPTGSTAMSSPIASRSTDANWIAANTMGILNDPNNTMTGHSSTKLNGQEATSSIKGVALFASPNGKSSGVVVALAGPLRLTKWTRINVLVSPL
jgi:hypothetical protein